MKPYPVTIPECKGSCRSGREPCKTEALCQMSADWPFRRVQPSSLSAAEVTDREYAETQEAPGWMYALVAIVALLCVVVVALPFVMGAI